MTRTFDDILGKDSIANLQQPIETAKGLPASAYTSQDFLTWSRNGCFRAPGSVSPLLTI